MTDEERRRLHDAEKLVMAVHEFELSWRMTHKGQEPDDFELNRVFGYRADYERKWQRFGHERILDEKTPHHSDLVAYWADDDAYCFI